jgi:DNA-binding NarL/FixJ family response regulator
MSYRKKILILEHDDFLREIIGNLLHKRDGYILNGACIEEGLADAKNHQIDTVIVGDSCPDYNDKQSINYLKKNFNDPELFLINTKANEVNYLPKKHQFMTKDLSIQHILESVLPE